MLYRRPEQGPGEISAQSWVGLHTDWEHLGTLEPGSGRRKHEWGTFIEMKVRTYLEPASWSACAVFPL